ncbi:hypothetical protein SAMN04488063_0105 [Halopelagius inordinatus]|uniref:Protein NO VEIN C-terminal domain-containing protein n=1 Tax=Halopelagius inordinatus TaxID=553467 RepID=A0A1I2X3Q2_9EURY|nr:hypothetical protein [Halopelagius inordinatus]SFH07667.1 hypothetical protein SAMN04488063_0105 [Halopelagius inordinatus]
MSDRKRMNANESQGMDATHRAAAEFGLEVDTETADWYDAVGPTGEKYEVKSTVEEYSGEYSDGDPGRFRLWEDQHVSLVHADASGTAFYVFVLFDEPGVDGDVVDMKRLRPSEVTEIVNDVGDGEWNLAKHPERRSRQQKVPWTAVFDR